MACGLQIAGLETGGASQAAFRKGVYGSRYGNVPPLLVSLVSSERDVRRENTAVGKGLPPFQSYFAHARERRLALLLHVLSLGAEWAPHGGRAIMSTKRSVRLLNSQQRVRDKGNLTGS